MEAVFIFLFSFTFTILFRALADTMVVNQVIRDGETIISPQQNFELGFFSPGNATESRYVGIWFKRLATGTIVWVANRDNPIRNRSGELTLHPDGVLVLRDSANNRVIWSSSTEGSGRNLVARLLDTGNLMITDDDNGQDNYIWQSFDYFGDTDLPEMKFGRNSKGIVTNYTSWKSLDDPSKGSFMVYMDFSGLPQIFQKKGDMIQYRLGSWNGIAFTGRPRVRFNSVYTFKYVSNEKEIYTTTELINSSVLAKLTVSPDGYTARYRWFNKTQGWFLFSSVASDTCFRYSLCGPYGSCDTEKSPFCGCLKGFTPTRLDQWDLGDWSGGCLREIPLDCGVGEGFRKYPYLKLRDTRQSWFDTNMTIKQCKRKCKSECNCTAYATLNVVYGTGCLLWHGELIDMRRFPDAGQDIYIRMATAELDKDKKLSRYDKVRIIVIPVVLGFVILLVLFLLIIKRRKMKAQEQHAVLQKPLIDLPFFSLSALLSATDNFSDDNKLGEGGFGPVHKGFLEDGLEVAVKRLSKSSNQGIEEFKNELYFISKLQHRNLVKILGYCIDGEERLLVYEYMPNKGLDLYIYQEDKSKKLDWSRRFHIINGIARGLLYLHQDSQVRIIHRDLKAANILLDHEMNPKISDFGTARSFTEDITKTKTKRLVGTYGYMSPEYAGKGIISVKSDIFSFGVILLEVLSGKRNRRFSHEVHSQNLLGHAWKLYKQGKALELINVSSLTSNQISEALQSIQVALLCVQHNPDNRPNMSEVITMLSGKGQLAEPKQPGFFTEYSCESSTTTETHRTHNNVTVTILEAR